MHGDEVPELDDRAKRFIFRRRLGEGAFGVVWEVFDCERDARVALKSLIRTDPNALYRFKREFRALADIVHPNLVGLYELLSFRDRWFFTMEFIDGVDFIRYVSATSEAGAGSDLPTVASDRDAPPTMRLDGDDPASRDPSAWYDQPTQLSSSPPDAPSEPGAPRIELRPRFDSSRPSAPSWNKPRPLRFDPDRLRSGLRQLTEGLVALHGARKLHRDIKPSNVLVATDGRVSILDFGLITELAREGVAQSMDLVVGTPGYMSPEQAMGQALTPATDWYSVGVMLYAALTGRQPFDGSPTQMLLTQQRFDPVAPGVLAPGLPGDLEELCVDLLRRNPEDRPTGEQILERLGPDSISLRARTSIVPRTSQIPFVGREPHLAALKQAYAASRSGGASVVLVHGGSGMGKSALVRHFLENLRAETRDAVVLVGRCYPRESVPYKALDSLIDELSVFLQRLSMLEAHAIMPRGAWALGRVFPVLDQVPAFAEIGRRATDIADPHEVRRRAFGALRELFARLGERRPLVLAIDDLQWSDADSNALIAEVLRGPDPPSLMLIASYRTDDLASQPLVQALLEPSAGAAPIHVRDLPVGEFTPDETRRLAAALLGPNQAARAAQIAEESGGNPFFIDALARHSEAAAARSSGAVEKHLNLAEVIHTRVESLPLGARALLEVIVVAGHPIEAAVAYRAAGTESHDPAMMAVLVALHLVRSSSGSTTKLVESYHDRIRVSVLDMLSPDDRKRLQGALAHALEASGHGDAETLAMHFHAAGEPAKATAYAITAAENAAAALAFDRAASLYELSFALTPGLDAVHRARMGDALANAGRGAAAADAYLEAAAGKSPSAALDLRRRAAEQLLLSGHVDRGLAIIRQVLDSFGMKLAESPKGALFSLIARRARLRVRGLRFKERPAADVPAEELMRVDACWSVAVGLSLVDNIRGADYQARHLLLALQAGEPHRIARALAVEVAYSAASGLGNEARSDELVRMATDLAERSGNPHSLGLAITMAGAAQFLIGRWAQALKLAEQGAAILRERCTGVAWELDTAEVFVLSSLHRLGRWRELAARAAETLRSAHARGDLYLANQVRLDTGWNADLAADAPDEAEARVEDAFRHSADREFDTQHYLRVNAVANIRLYRGEVDAARKLVESTWPSLKSSFTLEIQAAHMDCLELRARATVACAAAESATADQRATWLKAASKDVARIESEKLPWASAEALLLKACIESVRDDAARALELAAKAEQALRANGMGLYAAVAARRKGQLAGGAAGAAEVAAADRDLAAEGVKSPERLAGMIAPGKWRKRG